MLGHEGASRLTLERQAHSLSMACSSTGCSSQLAGMAVKAGHQWLLALQDKQRCDADTAAQALCKLSA